MAIAFEYSSRSVRLCPKVAPNFVCCQWRKGGYCHGMAGQEIAALSIVGLTAAVFVWRLVKPRGFGTKKGLACSCAGASPGSMPTMVFKARKGERAQILVKAAPEPVRGNGA